MDVPDLPALFELISLWVDATFPDAKSVLLRIEMASGELAALPVPAAWRGRRRTGGAGSAPPGPAPPGPAAPALNELESAVVEVVDALGDGERLSGEEVAQRTGYPYAARLREALARLGRAGLIRSLHPGYGRGEGRPQRRRRDAG